MYFSEGLNNSNGTKVYRGRIHHACNGPAIVIGRALQLDIRYQTPSPVPRDNHNDPKPVVRPGSASVCDLVPRSSRAGAIVSSFWNILRPSDSPLPPTYSSGTFQLSTTMKTATFLLLATVVAVTAAQNETQSCDLGAIEGSLLPNGTQWHDSCAAATGVDVFNMEGELPTKEEAKKVQQSRDCVNYLNQINQQANSMIQCETTVGDQSVNFGSLLTDLLKGQSSNKTKEAVVGSDSMSGSVSLSASDSGSESTSTSESASGSESESASGSEEISSGSTDAQGSDNASKSAGVAVTATFSIIAAAATTVLAFAL